MARSKKPKQEKAPPVEAAHDSAAEAKKLAVLVCLVWLGLTIAHAAKALGLYPLIIPDEYTYISDIRHRAFEATLLPGYLYYAFYSLTGLFGNAFLDAGRVQNAVVFMLSAPFLHATAKRVCGGKIALFLTFAVLAGPLSSYTAYFMPESMYFTLFCALAWFLAGRDTADTPGVMFMAGAGIGLLALVKMHGIFLLAGFLLFLVFATPDETINLRLRRTAKQFATVLGGFVAVRFGLGLLFAGSAGLHLLGVEYASLADEGRASVRLLSLIPKVLYNLLGNGLGMGLVMGIPLLCALFCLTRASLTGETVDARLRRLSVFAFSMLVPLLCVSALFCGLVDEHYPQEFSSEVTRIQWRFYNFLFPFFLIAACGVFASGKALKIADWRGKWLFLIPAACALYAAATGFAGYTPSTLPDCPELGSMHRFPAVFLVYSAVSAALAAGCLIRPGKFLGAYLFALVPIAALVGSGVAQYQAMMGNGVFPDIYDKAGMFAKHYLGDECRDLTLVDAFINSGKKSLIHIDNADTDLVTQFDNTVPVDMGRIRPGKNWLLLTGDFSVPREYDKFHIIYTDPAQTDELTAYMRLHRNTRGMLRYALVRIADYDYSVDFRSNEILWPVREITIRNTEAAIRYAATLTPGGYSVALENTADETALCELKAIDENGGVIATATLRDGKNGTLVIPSRSAVSTLVLHAPGGLASVNRLRVTPLSAK